MASEEKVEQKLAAAQATAEMVAKLALSLGMNLATVFLHSPSQLNSSDDYEDGHLTTGFDIAEITEKAFEIANMGLDRVGLGREEVTTTGQSLGIFFKLLTEFTGPVVGLSSDEVYAALKAYVQLHNLTKDTERIKFGAPKPNIVELNRYTRFIMASYGAMGLKFLAVLPKIDFSVLENKAAISYLTGIDANECLVTAKWRTNWTGSIFKPGYYILLDHFSKEIIVTVRGSWRFQDVLTDLMIEDEPFDFTYHKDDEVKMALHGLDTVARSFGNTVSELKNNHTNLTVGEIQSNVKDMASEFADQLNTWIKKQASVARMGKALEKQDSTPPEHRKIKGMSHRGFVLASEQLASEIEPFVTDSLAEYPEYDIVLCGHSLGAAVATLITLMWAKIPKFRSVRCYTIASPSCVSLDIAKSPAAIQRIQSIILGDDIVPHISHSNAQDVRNAVIRIAKDSAPPEMNEKGENIYEGVPLSEWILRTAESNDYNKDICKALFQPIMDTLRAEEMTNPKLYPAGNIWHVIDEEKGLDGGVILKPPSAFSEIQFSSRMFIQHLPHKYAECCDPILPLRKKTEKDRMVDAKEGEKIRRNRDFLGNFVRNI